MGNVNLGDNNKCHICGHLGCEINSGDQLDRYYCYECPNCGEYFINDSFSELGKYDLTKLKSYMFYHKGRMIPYIISKESYQKQNKNNWNNIYNLLPEMVENWYPKTFSEKIDLILLKIDELSLYEGEYVNIKDILYDLFFCYEVEGANKSLEIQARYILNILNKNDYIECNCSSAQLTPKAYERIYQLRKDKNDSKNIFVSMSFNDDTKPIREAIRTAIIKAEYSPEFIDEIIHNHQIMPEMLRLIRECKMLILEISDPNYGAYYEAGYALGLGKEVIICCRKEVFTKEYKTKEEKKYAKYTKPHFDIAQKQILVWENLDDLILKLPQWIKAVE